MSIEAERARKALAGEWVPGMVDSKGRCFLHHLCRGDVAVVPVRASVDGPPTPPEIVYLANLTPDTTDTVTVLAMVAVALRRLDPRLTEGDAHAWKRLEVAVGEWVGGWLDLADLAKVVVDVLEATR